MKTWIMVWVALFMFGGQVWGQPPAWAKGVDLYLEDVHLTIEAYSFYTIYINNGRFVDIDVWRGKLSDETAFKDELSEPEMYDILKRLMGIQFYDLPPVMHGGGSVTWFPPRKGGYFRITGSVTTTHAVSISVTLVIAGNEKKVAFIRGRKGTEPLADIVDHITTLVGFKK